MLSSARVVSRLSTLGYLPTFVRTTAVKNAPTLQVTLLPMCSVCCQLSTTATVSTARPKSEEYLQRLLESKQLTSSQWAGKSHRELQSLIALIIDQYEYELYRKGYELLDTISAEASIFDEKQFHLELFELNDILHAQDEAERTRIINYFVASKTSQFVAKQNKKLLKTSKEEKEAYDKQRREVQYPTGLWNFENELIYGLWHNALFIKFKRSALSKLYDRRMVSAAVVDAANPRIILDCNYTRHMDYFHIRRLGVQIRQLFAINKYRSYQPFNVEFFDSQSRQSAQFDDLMGRIVSNWKQPEQFQYARHQGKTLTQLGPSPRSIYYIVPSAKKALTTEEVLHSESVFVLPAYVTGSLRDPVFSKINSDMRRLNVNVRRLPTVESVVWNKFHGVIGLDTIFSVLHDARYEVNFDWTTSFRRHITGEKIKAEEELIDIEKIRHERFKRRVQSIETSYQRRGDTAPRRIDTALYINKR